MPRNDLFACKKCSGTDHGRMASSGIDGKCDYLVLKCMDCGHEMTLFGDEANRWDNVYLVDYES